MIPSAAAKLGLLADQTVLKVDVTLRVRNEPALTAYLAGLSDRSSPVFGRYLRPAQFAARFGPTPAQIAAVDKALRAQGLTPGAVAKDRLSIPVRASAAALEHAFVVGLARYRLPGGRVAYANTAAPLISAGAAPYVQGVVGLDNVSLPQSLAVRPSSASGAGQQEARPAVRTALAAPKACAKASNTAADFGAFTAGQLATYYQMAPLYKLGDIGQGVRIALVEFEPNKASDIAAYKACYSLHTTITYKKVDGGSGTGAGGGEAALDIEDAAGLARGAAIDVYQGPNGSSSQTYDLYSAIINADKDQVVSTSWGLCELDSDPSLLSSEQTLFAQAATQGQTVVAASGDFGSTACLPDNAGNNKKLSVSDPASQPWVVGVGGTSIGAHSQSVWNNSAFKNGAGGGGLSASWCMPGYQDQGGLPGLIGADSSKSAACPAPGYVRQVPDVAADADPNTGYTIFWRGGWTAFGGTSAGAPLWAAVAALTDASPYCKDYGSGDAGTQPAAMYLLASHDSGYVYGKTPEVFRDITRGNNDYTPSGYKGGRYPATRGYDMATGLGTPLAGGLTAAGKPSNFYPGLTAAMCQAYATRLSTTSITDISAVQGPAASQRTVTITGTGFLPIPGADLLRVGSQRVTPKCTSMSRCTVTLPKMKPGTVALQMVVEDTTTSAITAKTSYRFVAAPAVSSLSPASGRARGGNTVTIKGSNFIGALAVRFGGKLATIVQRVSATEIEVKAPAGTGTVAVTVSAVGGKSAVVKASHYTYR